MNTLDPLFDGVLMASLRASVLVLVVLLIRALARKRLPARWRYALWLPVLAALLLPGIPLLPAPVVKSAPPAGMSVQPIPAQAQPVEIVAPPATAVEAPVVAINLEPLVSAAAPDVPPAAATTPPAPFPWRNLFVAAWLAGVVLAFSVVGGSYLLTLRRIRRRAVPAAPELLERIAGLARLVGLRHAPRVWLSESVAGPAVCGWWRPALLLNAAFPASFTDDEADMVLRHELTHIRRGDLLLNPLFCGLLALHWFNPLLWLAFLRVRADREAACDADVLRDEPDARRAAYGQTLLKMETAFPPSGLCLGFVGILQRGSVLRDRIQSIIAQPKLTALMKTTLALGIIGLAVLGLAKAAEPGKSTSAVESKAQPPTAAQVAIVVRPRKATFSLTEPVYFDVVVANPTTNPIVVPFIYDCVIDIDGMHYTEFPKPKLLGPDGKIIQGATFQATSEAAHGILTLGGNGLTTVDAETGKVPLKLAAGRHELVLVCGPYRSDTVVFTLTEDIDEPAKNAPEGPFSADPAKPLTHADSKEQQPLGSVTIQQATDPTPRMSGVSTEVIAAKHTVNLGEPILVSVRITNQTSEAVMVSRSATAFDCFDIAGPVAKHLRYIGFDGQIWEDRVEVKPFSAVTIAEAIDLTDKYLFPEPGHYSIQFNGKSAGLADSPAIAIDVTPGRLSDFDEAVVALLPICPEGWRLVKDGRGEVTPFGWSRVPGFALHLCHNHMRGEAVMLWFTKEEANMGPNQPQPGDVYHGQALYLGRMREYSVYASEGEKTEPPWLGRVKAISGALHIPGGVQTSAYVPNALQLDTTVGTIQLSQDLIRSMVGQTNAGETENKPAYRPKAPIPVTYEPLLNSGVQRLKDAGLDKKYDSSRPFLLHSPSQNGDVYVAFTRENIKPDALAYLQVFCLVEFKEPLKNGEQDRIRELPDADGLDWFVRLENGKVTRIRTVQRKQTGGAAAVADEATTNRVTAEFLTSRGFVLSNAETSIYTLERVTVGEAAKRLGFSPDQMEPTHNQSINSDIRTVKVRNLRFVVSSEVRDSQGNIVNGSLDKPDALCTVSVALAQLPENRKMTPKPRPLSEEETGVRLYTDQEAEAFRAKLDTLKYPTTPQAACEALGIDLKRLTGKAGVMMSSMDGRVGGSFAELSGNYWISFQFQLYLQGPDGKVVQNDKGEHDKVSIYTRVRVREVQKKEDKVEVSIHDETLFVEVVGPSGIGDARLAVTSGAWPKKVVVRLKYAANKPFTNLEGAGATLEETGKPGEDLKVRLLKESGYEADIPAAERKTLYLQWVDAYR